MKKCIFFLSVFLIAFNLQAQKKHVIKPITKKSPVQILYGKKKNYYHLDHNLDFSVVGLASVDVYSIERILKNTPGYSLTYYFDNGKEITYHTKKSIINSKSAYTNKSIRFRTSKSFKKSIKIPNGAKVLTIKPAKLQQVDVYVSSNKKAVKPILKTKKVKILKGKIANYYKLNSKIPTTIQLNEAGKLYVYTRKRLSKKDNHKYRFNYKMNNSIPVNMDVNLAKKSNKAVYKSLSIKYKPSVYNKTVIDVKEKSKIIFSSSDRVDARFVFVKKWNEVVQKKVNSIDLITKKGNKIRKYFRVSSSNKFSFKINAKHNTKGKIFLRGEFTYDMLSNSDYKIILKDFDKIITTYKLSCHRSKEMNYKNNADNIPGTLDKVFFDIPKGLHQYTISIGNRSKTALVRVMIKH